jgi:hypothetical protein
MRHSFDCTSVSDMKIEENSEPLVNVATFFWLFHNLIILFKYFDNCHICRLRLSMLKRKLLDGRRQYILSG